MSVGFTRLLTRYESSRPSSLLKLAIFAYLTLGPWAIVYIAALLFNFTR